MGILRNLDESFGIYAGASDDVSELPIKNKIELKNELLAAIMEIFRFHGYHLQFDLHA